MWRLKGSVIIISFKHGLKHGILSIVWLDRSFYFLSMSNLEPKAKMMMFFFFWNRTFLKYFEHLRNPFYIFDTIEGTPKSHPILISTVMKPVASPKIVWREIFGKIDGLRLITHLVKFLRKLSKIEGDKNFLKRGEVDVIYFRPLIIILLIFKDFSKL